MLQQVVVPLLPGRPRMLCALRAVPRLAPCVLSPSWRAHVSRPGPGTSASKGASGAGASKAPGAPRPAGPPSGTAAASTSKPPAPPPAAAKKKQIFPKGAHPREFRVWLDREKGNKVVTRIVETNGWKLPPGKEEYLQEMSKGFKQKCGTGGAVRKDTMEVIVQGDHRDTVIKMLVEWGHAAKKAGG